MQSQIDPTLPEETSGPKIGKVLIARLRAVLGVARDESSAHGTAIEAVQSDVENLQATDETLAQAINDLGTSTANSLTALDNSIPDKVRGAVLQGLSFTSSLAIVAEDTVLAAIGKIQAQLNGKANIQYGLDQLTAKAILHKDGNVAVQLEDINKGRKSSLRILLLGDSYAARSNIGKVVSSATVLNGVMTVNSAGHGLPTGETGTLAGANLASCRVKNVPITRVDTNTFTVPAPNAPDGAVAISSAARSGMSFTCQRQYSEEGLFVHLNRLSNGGISLEHNFGNPGYTVPEVVALWDEQVTPYQSDVDMIIFEAGYNSLAQGDTADAIIAAYETAIQKTRIPIEVTIPFPVLQGSSADSAAKLQVGLSVRKRLLALAKKYKHLTVTDTWTGVVNPATGYAKDSMIIDAPDGIHASALLSFVTAKRILEGKSGRYSPALPVISVLDSVATNAANTNVARNGLATTTNGGSVGGLTLSVPSDETTGVATYPANFAVRNVSLASGQVFHKPSLVSGNIACIRAVADSASDQGGQSLVFTPADIVPGARYNLKAVVSLRTDFNASNKTPAGQNVRALQMQTVIIIDGVTYTSLLSNPQTNAIANDYLDADLNNVIVSFDNILIPPGASLTTARIDFVAHFSGAGTVQVELSQVSFERVS